MMDFVGKKAALYACSLAEFEVENFLSVNKQLRIGRNWIAMNGAKIGGTFVDRCSSIGNGDSAFKTMMSQATCPDNPFDIIVVHPLSGFIRNRSRFAQISGHLLQCGVRIVVVTDKDDIRQKGANLRTT